MQPAGILLAAGRGRRFDHTGADNKLLAALPGGEPVVLASARKLLAELSTVIAVVAPDDGRVAEALRVLGCYVTICPEADTGMSASLKHGLLHAPHEGGWLIALGDMPYVSGATIAALCRALEQGAPIAVPFMNGRRGNPVAFSAANRDALLALEGDQGARAILKTHAVTEIAVDDPGIFADIDTRADLTHPADP